MSRTVRNYSYNGGREGAKFEKYLKQDDGYTGYVGEGIWNRQAKKLNKKAVTKHNRALRNIISDVDFLNCEA
jgi:hypothetical protein